MAGGSNVSVCCSSIRLLLYELGSGFRVGGVDKVLVLGGWGKKERVEEASCLLWPDSPVPPFPVRDRPMTSGAPFPIPMWSRHVTIAAGHEQSANREF